MVGPIPVVYLGVIPSEGARCGSIWGGIPLVYLGVIPSEGARWFLEACVGPPLRSGPSWGSDSAPLRPGAGVHASGTSGSPARGVLFGVEIRGYPPDLGHLRCASIP